MLNFDPHQDDVCTPSALRAMHGRFVAWCLVGVAFGFVLAICLGSPAKGAEPRTSSWSIEVKPNAAHPSFKRERSIDRMLRDLNAERARTTAKLAEWQARMIEEAQREAARRELDSLIYQLDARERHSQGRVNPDEL